MTKDEFCKLPIGLMLGLLWDNANLAARFADIEAPRAPLPPKFDSRIRRKEGFQWASETDLAGLLFWHGRASNSTDEKYREKNEKEAKGLQYWIDYRRAEPSAPWSGERNREQVSAAPPSAKPRVREWEPREDSPRAAAATGYGEAEYSDDSDGAPF